METSKEKWIDTISVIPKRFQIERSDEEFYNHVKISIKEEKDTAKLAEWCAVLIHGWYKDDICNWRWEEPTTYETNEKGEAYNIKTGIIHLLPEPDYNPCEDANQAFALLNEFNSTYSIYKLKLCGYQVHIHSENEGNLANYTDNTECLAIVKACLIAAAILAWETEGGEHHA